MSKLEKRSLWTQNHPLLAPPRLLQRFLGPGKHQTVWLIGWQLWECNKPSSDLQTCHPLIHPSTPPNPTFHRPGSLTSQPQASSGCGCAMAVPWLCHGCAMGQSGRQTLWRTSSWFGDSIAIRPCEALPCRKKKNMAGRKNTWSKT